MTGAEAVQPKLFRVDGFRNPTLSAERRRGLEATEALPLDMSVGGVLEAAEVRTLLEDFGPRDFEDRLGRLLAEVKTDQNVWRAAKEQFVEHCIQAAANRLKNRDFLKRNPKGGDCEIKAPRNWISFLSCLPFGTTTVDSALLTAPLSTCRLNQNAISRLSPSSWTPLRLEVIRAWFWTSW